MRKEPRLHFTDEERADPALEKPIRKADRAAARADKAQAKIPKKQVRQKTVDPKTGKVTTKLVLEDKKKPPSKLWHHHHRPYPLQKENRRNEARPGHPCPHFGCRR